MEKLHKEPGGYTKDSSSFTVELQKFHDTRGTPFRHAPRINGREVDLFALYNCVTSLGGWQKVNDHFRWEYVLEKLKFPKACANGSLALRQIYVRYLSSFEKVHYLGEDPDEDVDPTAEARSRKPNASLLCQVPLSYNKAQHELTEAQRAGANMAPLAPPASEYSKLCLSLLSCLPNEESLALNVCTLLSNEGRHVLRLDHCPRLVDLLLAQAGVFSLEDATLRPMYLECWQGVEGRRMERFWEDNLDSETISLFGLGTGHNDDDELFNLNYEVGTRSIEGQRILRIALIFHNLSFEERNVPQLASNPSFVRFVMMCALSRWSSLRQVALDTIGNLAAKLVLDPVETEWSGPLIRIAREGILSRDRYLVVRCLDIVGQLSRGERNEEPLLAQMDALLYGRIFELLTVHDLMLLVYALEALYLLSDLGPTACDHMLQVHQSVGILVSLLTLDPLAYGPTAQKGMRLIEVADPHPLPPHTPAVLRPAIPPEPLQQLPGTDPEAESFACTWVRAMYEPAQGCSVGRNDVYAEYVTFCNRAGRKNMVPASVFANCVKTVYNQTGIRRVDGPNGTVSLHHEGLRKRLAPLPVPIQVTSCLTISTQATPTRSPITPAAANHSPILKAQLSAPLRALTPPATPTGPPRPSPPSSPSAPPSTQGSSNLIKSLLANKVSRNLQRQQQLQQNLTQAESDVPTPVLASAATVAKPTETSAGSAGAVNVQNCSAQLNRPKSIQPTNNLVSAKPEKVLVATRPNGIQRDLMVEVKPQTEGERLQNHIGENGGAATTADGTRDVEMEEVKANSESEEKRKAPEVVYKSSPLLNGLLDKGKVPMGKEVSLQNGKAMEEDGCGDTTAKIMVTNGSVRVVASSDLSPISDIVGSVESASKVISRSNAEAVSCSQLESAPKRMAERDEEEEGSAKRPRLGTTEETENAPSVPQLNLVKLLSSDTSATSVKVSTVPTPSVIVSSAAQVAQQQVISRTVPSSEMPISSISSTPRFSTPTIVVASPSPVQASALSRTVVVQANVAPSPVPLSVTPSVQATTFVPQTVTLPVPVSSVSLPVSATASGIPSHSVISTAQGTIVVPTVSAAPQGATVIATSTLALTAQTPTIVPVMAMPSVPGVILTHRMVTVPVSSVAPPVVVPGTAVVSSIPSTHLTPKVVTVASSDAVPVARVVSSPAVSSAVATPSQVSAADTVANPTTSSALESSPLVFTAPTSSTASAVATIVTTGVVTVSASTPSTTATAASSSVAAVATCKTPVTSASPASADDSASVATASTAKTVTVTMKVTDTSKGAVTTETEKKSAQPHQHHHHHHHHHKPAKLMYHCEWKGCERTFTTPSAVLFHACKMHVPKSEGDFLCQWEGCDDMKRRRLSLFTHLQDRHCSEQVLQIQAVRRQQISQFGKASLPPPAQPPPHPGYAPDAAYLAIRRHALAYYNHRDAADEKESALAKSIRLTSALVLRNLATHSALARRRLRRYEQQLSAVAMSPLESSRTIAQCLREMSRAPSPN